MPTFNGPKININNIAPEPSYDPPAGLGTSTTVHINNETFGLAADELEVVCELGRGAYGDVHKMRERRTGNMLAVKRIRYTMNTVEQQRTAMDLDIAMRSLDCPYTIHFYGAMFRDGDVWICMEVMDLCLDKFYRRIVASGDSVQESILSMVAFAVVSGLHYLHNKLKVIHRDVKPSNILVSKNGAIKLCDFGISAYLIDSIAKTKEAGTSNYLAPERIEPQTEEDADDDDGCRPDSYTVKADVWSLGITLLEVAEGSFPYPQWKTPFDQLRLVVEGPPPALRNPDAFTPVFQQFLTLCLHKRPQQRSGYTKLLQHAFITERSEYSMFGALVQKMMEKQQ